MYDIVIIGGGVCGAAIARELSRFQACICVVERDVDVCCGTSKANSGIVHAGFDAIPGTMMARMNVRGNERMESLCQELNVPFRRNGSLVTCRKESDRIHLEELLERGRENGVQGLEILNREELLEREPHLSDQICAALYAPTGGIVCPFELTIALAENAYENGVEFRFQTEVESVRKQKDHWELQTSQGLMEARCVVNAAGVYADTFHNMVSEQKLTIVPRKGEYFLLDKTVGDYVQHTIFQLPGAHGKGVLVAPTTHGNIIVGPTAVDIPDKEGVNTTAEGLAQVMEKQQQSVADLPMKKVITSFAGLRAHGDREDFVIGKVQDGFFDCAAIESPGLTSAPAIGELLASQIGEDLHLERKKVFHTEREGIINPKMLTRIQYEKLVKEHPEYGTIICRCEGISKGEILEAIRRPLGARTLDGVKRRTRAGMGRCQSGFCMPRVMEILAEEQGISMDQIQKSGEGSCIIPQQQTEGRIN